MSNFDQAIFNEMLRRDFRKFLRRSFMTLNPGSIYQPNWSIDALAYRLELVRRGQTNRQLICMPPRHLKSLAVSVAFPAFLLGHDPSLRILAISYGSELSHKHARDFRLIVGSAWYHRAFPKMRIARSTEDEVTTTSMGFRKTTSVEGPLTGLGGDIAIIDDPQKGVDALSESRRNSVNHWVSNTLLSRLDDKKKGIIIVVMQRVHMDDLCGYLGHLWPHCDILSLPAIAEVDERIQIGDNEFYDRVAGEALHPDRESIETLLKLQQEIGSYDFNAQFQQSPVPPGGAMIKCGWRRYYEKHELPERSYRTKVVQSWDTAAKAGVENDWSVCTTWLVHDKTYYLLDLVRGRYEYPRLREIALNLAEHHKPDVVLIEDASSGTALAQELTTLLRRSIKPVPIERDKVGRMSVQTVKLETGSVLFPKDAPFLAELERELFAFPYGKHDDQVDSISQALAHEFLEYTLDYV